MCKLAFTARLSQFTMDPAIWNILLESAHLGTHALYQCQLMELSFSYVSTSHLGCILFKSLLVICSYLRN